MPAPRAQPRQFSTPNEELQFSINSARRLYVCVCVLNSAPASRNRLLKLYNGEKLAHCCFIVVAGVAGAANGAACLLLRYSDVTTRPWSTANGNRYRHTVRAQWAEPRSYQQQHQGAINAKIIIKAD